MLGLSGPGGKAIAFYPTMPKGYNQRPESNEYSYTIKMSGKSDSAARIKKLEEKLESNPTDADLYAQLAAGYSYEGRLSDSIRCLETAIKLAPPSANVHGVMAEALVELGRFDEAFTHFQKAAALEPEKDGLITRAAQTGLGICLHELGNDDAALVHFQAAAHMEPSKAAIQSNLVMALINLKRYSEAIVPAQRAVDLEPDNARSAMLLGILLDKESRQPRGRALLGKGDSTSTKFR